MLAIYDQVMYQTNKGVREVGLIISHPSTGAPRPFTLTVSTFDGSASMFLWSIALPKRFLHVYSDGDYIAVSGERCAI